MAASIAIIGVPTALGGNLPDGRHEGMAAVPAELRRRGLVARLEAAGHAVRDHGDVTIDPPFRADADRSAQNRSLIAEFLPREAAMVAAAVPTGDRLMILGGDCCCHAGAMAGLRRAQPGRRLAIAWFDAHGDFNTPESTPSGHIWGMPFAMLCGRGPADLVVACDGPTVDERHAVLIGGQVLDEVESRTLAASHVAVFGPGMLSTPAGIAALHGWAESVAREVDGLYIAIDHDVLDADQSPWAITMPEPEGLSIETAIEVVRTVATAIPVVGYGASALNFSRGDGDRTFDAAARLAEAAFATA
jgi:arginase